MHGCPAQTAHVGEENPFSGVIGSLPGPKPDFKESLPTCLVMRNQNTDKQDIRYEQTKDKRSDKTHSLVASEAGFGCGEL